MRKTTSCFMLILLLGFCLANGLAAATWPALEKALESWQGAREVQLRGAADDPLASAELLPLVELFLRHNFAVSTVTGPGAAGAGLAVELRRTAAAQTLVVLKRAEDGAIIALERFAAGDVTAAVTSPAVPPLARPQPPPRKALRPAAPIPLDGAPVSVAWLGGSYAAGGDLALLSGAGVTLYRLQGKQLQKRAVLPPPRSGLRPLALSRGDLDGDGSFELAAVWAEDLHSIYDGTDSAIWSQLFAFARQELTPLGLQPGYVRLFDSLGVTQLRGRYSAFSGPVKQLRCRQGQLSVDHTLPWGKRDIFSLAPFGDGGGLAWLKPGELALLSLETGEPLPGGTLIENFGVSQSAEIAVRLEDPEYRSGFEKEDKVMEVYTPLPARLEPDGAQSVFTVYHGRNPGTLLFGQPAGEDQLVRLSKMQGDLILEYPFPAVKSFIVDFTLLPGAGGSDALLLLNDEEDAGGRAFLVYQSGD